MTVLTSIATILGVVIGAVWVGIGVKLGGDLYEQIFQKKIIKGIKHSRKIQKWIKGNGRIVVKKIKEEENDFSKY